MTAWPAPSLRVSACCHAVWLLRHGALLGSACVTYQLHIRPALCMVETHAILLSVNAQAGACRWHCAADGCCFGFPQSTARQCARPCARLFCRAGRDVSCLCPLSLANPNTHVVLHSGARQLLWEPKTYMTKTRNPLSGHAVAIIPESDVAARASLKSRGVHYSNPGEVYVAASDEYPGPRSLSHISQAPGFGQSKSLGVIQEPVMAFGPQAVASNGDDHGRDGSTRAVSASQSLHYGGRSAATTHSSLTHTVPTDRRRADGAGTYRNNGRTMSTSFAGYTRGPTAVAIAEGSAAMSSIGGRRLLDAMSRWLGSAFVSAGQQQAHE
jgi:hypothetical protein